MKDNREQIIHDIAVELENVAKCKTERELDRASALPLLDLVSGTTINEDLTRGAARQIVVDTALDLLEDSPESSALRSLLGSGEDRWTTLEHRGQAAGGWLGMTYDGLRKRAKDGTRRLGELFERLARTILESNDVVALVFGDELQVATTAAPLAEATDSFVFMSYVRADDEHEGGQMSRIRDQLMAEFRFSTGQELTVFQDKHDIEWGQNWRRTLEGAIDKTSLLLVMLTPSYLNSEICREELARFFQREQQLGRDDLVLTLYYSTIADTGDDELAAELLNRNYFDWRDLRFAGPDSVEFRRKLAEMISAISAALSRPTAAPTLPRPLDDEAEPGVVERISDMELAVPRYIGGMVNMAAEQHGINDEVRTAAAEMERMSNRGGAAKLIVSRRLSGRLEPYAERLEEEAERMSAALEEISPGIEALAEGMVDSDEEDTERAAEGLLTSVEELLVTSTQSAAAFDGMRRSFDQAGKASSTMKPVLSRISSATSIIPASTIVFEKWKQQLADGIRRRGERSTES